MAREGKERRYRINYQIRSPKVRVIDERGNQLGILDIKTALDIAKEKNLDLVEIVPDSNLPVCRILDFKRFLFEQKKKEKEIKKKQKTLQTKEIRFTPETSEHDYKFKKQHIENFLKEGHRVKVSVFYKGREILYKERGYALLERLIRELSEYGKIDKAPKLEGVRLSVTFIPIDVKGEKNGKT
ncbi:MAG TPA: translation initiation factor IF-3 [bacterium]|nr:translation initiation factor IF-3 [bacterium]HOM26310.1 translation initiation factor IF-3 [bacterium]